MDEKMQREIAQIMDVTLVKNDHTFDEMDSLVEYAQKYPFACLFVMQCYLEYVSGKLAGKAEAKLGGLVGFPSGADFTDIKIIEAEKNVALGVSDLDMVINIGWLLSGKYELVKDEIKRIKDIVGPRPLKCIIEISRISEDHARKACELIAQVGAEYVKTGTGWFGPATIEQVRLIKSVVGDDVLIKAAGGIRDIEAIRAFRAEGVHRIGLGLSSAIDILKKL